MKSKIVEIYDTTLRDGAQSKDIIFSLQDKLRITSKLDEFGVHYIEGGWPGSNPKDEEYFKKVKELSLENSEVVAFGSTRRSNLKVHEDPNIDALIKSDVKTVTIFGKSWDLHVISVLNTTLEENLNMIFDSISYLKEHGLRVFFDAEHFYDGFKNNKDYAINVLKTAIEAKADVIILCDTNGGTLPHEFLEITKEVKSLVNIPIGVHCHNDSGVAVANSLLGVIAGATQIQGTINGIGERCGNADICQIIPALELKMGIHALKTSKEKLKSLKQLSLYLYEILHMRPNPYQPYVGENAFAHKGGVHVDAVLKNKIAYEHISPEEVGNIRLFSISELSGKANIIAKAKEFGFDIKKDDPIVANILNKIKELEYKGYHLEGANGTLYLLIAKELGLYKKLFHVIRWRTISESHNGDTTAESSIKIRVGDREIFVIAEGNGPVNAQDKAIRKAMMEFFPEIEKVQLINYKVSIADTAQGTASSVRTFIEFTDGKTNWITVGVSTNILEASKEALIDGYDYYLQRLKRKTQ
ncbi:MAG: citramalate synthase [Candidatus Methanomethylicota archaeon]|uniref:Citramalate synthase n=1 Tax=Thermoproteota archaeon TaxID=2056631 RepID=A0A520KFH9_9CREN|nr:MAG: citramalate synthase [Candidatus Verstraetearchaeota archaeon]TDA37781.1 MAG: citramalate synthase [Candidatus Verstraetearchaeota archaeon]